MNLLFRYILREYFKIFAMCVSALMTIYIVIDFFEKVRRFIRYDAELLDVLAYFVLRIPWISFQMAPLAILTATLLTLGVLSRNHEITAMRSCGISLYRLASPFLFLSLLVACLLLAFSATVIPIGNSLAEQVRMVNIEKRIEPVAMKPLQSWSRISNEVLMNIDRIAPGGAMLAGVRLYQLSPSFYLEELTEAKEARYTEKGWVLLEGVRRQFLPDGTVMASEFQTRPIPLAQIPDDFARWLSVDSETMTLRDIREFLERLGSEGVGYSRLQTDYYGRIAFPFVAVIMVIVGMALSLRRSGVRGGGMAMGIGQALLLGFGYWVTHSLAIALGRSGVLMPALAGWMANLIFLTFGFYLFLKVRY
jgi:lipopolysaccharide export system permease protein